MSDIKSYEKRFNSLKQESETWKGVWKDLSRYIRPTRGFFDAQPNQGKSLDHKTVIDSHAARAVRIMAAGMTSGLTSPSRPWFKLGVADADLMQRKDVKMWLNTVENHMMTTFERSNVYGALYSVYEEIGVFGTGAMAIFEDFHNVVRARNFTAGEYFIGTGPDMRVDSFGRYYWMTVGQIVEEFGIDNVSTAVKDLFERGSVDQWRQINHLIEPNSGKKHDKKDFHNMDYCSIYWETGCHEGKALKKSGYKDFPVLAPRWDITTSSDFYGKSPGWDALGDVKMLQKLQKDKLIALDKMINPPMQIDSSIQGEANLLPGGITRFNASMPNGGVKPAYQIAPDLQAIEYSITQTKQAISSTFYSDLFMMIAQADTRQMTAREVVERHEEKLLMLGPVLERLESELLDPMIDRTFNIMVRNGMVPQPPQALQGMELKVEYISMLAQAQKMVGTTSIEQTLSFAGNLAAAFPQVLDVIDADTALIEYGTLNGINPKIIRSPDEIAALRAQRQQAAQAQAQQEQMMNMVQGAKTLSETKVGQNSALDAILGKRS